MVKIKRIKTKEDLIDALCMILEDMSTFELANRDTINSLSSTIDRIRREK